LTFLNPKELSVLQSGRSRGIGLGKEEEEQLRTFIVNMVSEPLVLVIKLADRLHNMRTVFALKRDKQKAVATETLQVWCSLAERLGMMVLKVRFFSLHDLAVAAVKS
jgi:(p)ppGpp synthase/HD superfamily hydrolase